MKTALLAIDTSTTLGSVALLHAPDSPDNGGGELLFLREFAGGRNHSSQLFAVLEDALAIVPAREIARIVVGLGPGSYAGVRIGLSAATGLALAGGAELVGVPSILGLAEGRYAVLGDARQESHYLAIVEPAGKAGTDSLIEANLRLIPNAELTDAIAALPAELPRYSSDLPEERMTALQLENRMPSAQRLAELVISQRCALRSEPLEPIYLRAPHITKPKAVAAPSSPTKAS